MASTPSSQPKARDLDEPDLGDVSALADQVGQRGEWTAMDAAYVDHLARNGRFVVADLDGQLAGYAATRLLRTDAGDVSMLSDLFVSADRHGRGIGRALLDELWPGSGRRMTFSSDHPSALPLYVSFGLRPWWPLLALQGAPARLPMPAGWAAQPSTAAEVAHRELVWTGVDRKADHAAWSNRPGGYCFEVVHGADVLGAGTIAGVGAELGVVHFAVPVETDPQSSATALLAAVAAIPGLGGDATAVSQVCLPGPHPALPTLLGAGWRITTTDIFMATDAGLLDPLRVVPSPALA